MVSVALRQPRSVLLQIPHPARIGSAVAADPLARGGVATAVLSREILQANEAGFYCRHVAIGEAAVAPSVPAHRPFGIAVVITEVYRGSPVEKLLAGNLDPLVRVRFQRVRDEA